MVYFESDDIKCYHPRGLLKIVFMPTIADVLAKLPLENIEKYDYFKVLECIGNKKNFHVSKVRFYKSK